MRYYLIYEPFNIKSFLSNIVMATVPIASQITSSEDNRTDSDTDLSIINTHWRGKECVKVGSCPGGRLHSANLCELVNYMLLEL